MINILLVDDHQIVIDGLKGLLEGEDQIGILYEAQDGASTIDIAAKESIDLILLDINLPDRSGFDICKELKSKTNCPKIIALTMYGNAGYITKMINSGVDGYLLKNTGRAELFEAIQTIMKGERYFSKEVTDTLLAGTQTKKPKVSDFIQKLTRREKEILQLIVDEFTTDEMAGKLFISSTTVITHRRSLLRKLNAKNTAGLVKKAFEFGLLND